MAKKIKPPDHVVAGNVVLRLCVLEVTESQDGVPTHCRIHQLDSTIHNPQGKTFINAYLPRDLFRRNPTSTPLGFSKIHLPKKATHGNHEGD